MGCGASSLLHGIKCQPSETVVVRSSSVNPPHAGVEHTQVDAQPAIDATSSETTAERDAHLDTSSIATPTPPTPPVLLTRLPSNHIIGRKRPSGSNGMSASAETPMPRQMSAGPLHSRQASTGIHTPAWRSISEDPNAAAPRSPSGSSMPGNVGTLTGWQLLAQQVLADLEADQQDTHNPLDGALDHDDDDSYDDGHDITTSTVEDATTSTSNSDFTAVTATDPSVRPATARSGDADDFAAAYELIDVLGQGAFGRAIKARRLCDGQFFCVKVMQLNIMTPKDRKEATKEATLLASLHHPNIVQYCEWFNGPDDALHLVMEFCNGGDLARHLQRQQGRLLQEDDIMLKFVQICLGLHHVHKQGIMHRDLKTNNIFIAANNVLKIGDFGISKVMMGDTACVHSIVGTPSYLPPEVCQDKPYNKKVDVWALGCVLYEMCTLKHAFSGSSVAAITIKILSGKYSPIPDQYSPDLKNLVAILLERNPRKRPSMGELLRTPFVLQHLQQYREVVHKGIAVDNPIEQGWLEESVALVDRLEQQEGAAYSQGSFASVDTDLLASLGEGGTPRGTGSRPAYPCVSSSAHIAQVQHPTRSLSLVPANRTTASPTTTTGGLSTLHTSRRRAASMHNLRTITATPHTSGALLPTPHSLPAPLPSPTFPSTMAEGALAQTGPLMEEPGSPTRKRRRMSDTMASTSVSSTTTGNNMLTGSIPGVITASSTATHGHLEYPWDHGPPLGAPLPTGVHLQSGPSFPSITPGGGAVLHNLHCGVQSAHASAHASSTPSLGAGGITSSRGGGHGGVPMSPRVMPAGVGLDQPSIRGGLRRCSTLRTRRSRLASNAMGLEEKEGSKGLVEGGRDTEVTTQMLLGELTTPVVVGDTPVVVGDTAPSTATGVVAQ